MRVLALSWDADRPGHLPPRLLGLGRALAALGHHLHVVAAGTGPTETTTSHDGVPVTWVTEAPPVLPRGQEYVLARVLAWNSRAFATADRLARADRFDVVLADGWQTTHAATNLRSVHALPVVAALPTIEVTRSAGTLSSDTSKLVHQIEWWLTFEARRVLTSTRASRRDLVRAFRLPVDKVDVVPPGAALTGRGTVAAAGFGIVAPSTGPLTRHATALATRLAEGGAPVALVGPPPAHRDVVASSPDEALSRRVVVVLADDRADLAVQTLAAGRVLVVADGHGLHEYVHHRRSGWRIDLADVDAAASELRSLHADDTLRARLGRGARARVRDRHAWTAVAAEVAGTLELAVVGEAELAAPPPTELRLMLLRSPLLGLDEHQGA